jgi:hypothetical protein
MKKKTPQRPNQPRQVKSLGTKPLAKPSSSPHMQRFWALVDAPGGFRAALEALDDAALLEAHAAFHEAMTRAFDSVLWSAAELMHRTSTPDQFAAFRAGLIGLGHAVFEAALREPDSLADIADVKAKTSAPFKHGLPTEVAKARGLKVERLHPAKKPTRDRVRDDELEIRFPRIAGL